MNEGFDLESTYVFLADGGRATVVELTDSFWPELMSGNYTYGIRKRRRGARY